MINVAPAFSRHSYRQRLLHNRPRLSGFGILLIFLLFLSGKANAECQRIVSLAPTVTETIFALGLGDRLIGVTTFCDYPEQAKKIPQLGSYFDTNIEKALAMKTDLVIGLPESRLILQRFSAKNIPVLEISNRSIEQIIASFTSICEVCGCDQRELESGIMLELQQIEKLSKNRPHKKAAVLVASSVSKENIEFYLSGDDGYYSSLLKVLNITNVVKGNTFALPGASFESLIALHPDVIFNIGSSKVDIEKIRKYLPEVQIIQLDKDYAAKPGPRFIELLKDMQSGLDGHAA